MVFSYQKLTSLKPQKEKKLATFFIAAIVAAGFFVPYMLMSEGYFTFFGDFEKAKNLFRGKEEIIGRKYAKNMGNENNNYFMNLTNFFLFFFHL